MFTFGFNPIRGWVEDFKDFATSEVLLFLRELNPNHLAGQAEGNEDGATVGETSHRFAAVGEFFESDLVLGHFLFCHKVSRRYTKG